MKKKNQNPIQKLKFKILLISIFNLLDVNLTQATTDSNSSTSPLTHHNKHSEKEFDTIPNDVDATAADQLVKPSKIHVQPLHADDLLYESMKFDPSAGMSGFFGYRINCVKLFHKRHSDGQIARQDTSIYHLFNGAKRKSQWNREREREKTNIYDAHI